MILAAMDVGTNSCRLLLAKVQDNRIISRYREIETTRIGKGLLETSRLDEEGIKKTLACLARWRDLMVSRKVDGYRLVGTNAVRSAADGEEFAWRVYEATGLKLEIISGEREAELSYRGAAEALRLPVPPLVADLGGGSTEFTCFMAGKRLMLSLPLGAVRALEGGWDDREYRRLLSPVALCRKDLSPHPLVMVGGTATSLAAIDQGLEVYDEKKVQGYVLTREKVEGIRKRLLALPLSERRTIPGVMPDRADILPYGAGIMLAIMDVLERDSLMVADSDLLDALIYEMMPSS